MVKTKLKYSVIKKEYYDFKTDRIKNKIVSRGFEFYVINARTEKEHCSIINDFSDFLDDNNVNNSIIGSGSWQDNVYYKEKSAYLWISIEIDDVSEKDDIKELYSQWKKQRIKREGK